MALHVIAASPPAAIHAPPTSRIARTEDASELQKILACTSLGYLLRGRATPKTAEEWKALLAGFGTVSETSNVFSDAVENSNLENPRHQISLKDSKFKNDTLTPDLANRVFIASNLTVKTEPAHFEVRKVELQTWNWKKKHFEFGVVEKNENGEWELKLLPLGNCSSCHKNGAQAYRGSPWSNGNAGPIADALRETLPKELLGDRPGSINLFGDIAVYDARIRAAANLFRQHQVPLLVKNPNDQIKFLTNLLTRELFEKPENTGLLRDAQVARLQALSKDIEGMELPANASAFLSDKLKDVPLSKAMGLSREPTAEEVIQYSKKRFEEDFVPHEALSPKNSSAFEPPLSPQEVLGRPLSGAIGDLKLDNEDVASRWLKNSVENIFRSRGEKPNSEEYVKLLEEVVRKALNEPELKAFIDRGIIPERHELLPALRTSLVHVLKRDYPRAKPEAELEPLPPLDPYLKDCYPTPELASVIVRTTEACGRCHIGPEAQKLLPTDPLDPVKLAAWGSKNTRQVKEKFFKAIYQRLFILRDMPPPEDPEDKLVDRASDQMKKLRTFLEGEVPLLAQTR